jgi:8-oxo-dGTP pyrophosphatase MutT (NUDIX family)
VQVVVEHVDFHDAKKRRVRFLCRVSEVNAPPEVNRLAQMLSTQDLPGWSAQQLACPPGRPPDVVSRIDQAKRAGVMCLLCPDKAQEWSVVLMLRTADGTAHSDQLAFPGGSEDPEDAGDLQATAQRECWEEVGVHVTDAAVLGALSPLYIPPSDFWVQPFVAWSAQTPEFRLQEEEVADVLVKPLQDFPQAGMRWPSLAVAVRGGRIHAPGWTCGEHVLWGATAMMMAELLAVCKGAGFGPSFAVSTQNEE